MHQITLINGISCTIKIRSSSVLPGMIATFWWHKIDYVVLTLKNKKPNFMCALPLPCHRHLLSCALPPSQWWGLSSMLGWDTVSLLWLDAPAGRPPCFTGWRDAFDIEPCPKAIYLSLTFSLILPPPPSHFTVYSEFYLFTNPFFSSLHNIQILEFLWHVSLCPLVSLRDWSFISLDFLLWQITCLDALSIFLFFFSSKTCHGRLFLTLSFAFPLFST